MSRFSALSVLLLALTAAAAAPIGEYQTRAQFLQSVLGSAQAPSATIWLDDETRPRVADILGRTPDMLRVRYWFEGARTAWIIDEIGKEKPITLGVMIKAEKPITFGIVVENGKVHALQVLQFRESRGWEIRYPFFTNQFTNLRLTGSGELDHRIDSISGATLSVNAATRVARLALLLDEHARRTNTAIAEAT